MFCGKSIQLFGLLLHLILEQEPSTCSDQGASLRQNMQHGHYFVPYLPQGSATLPLVSCLESMGVSGFMLDPHFLGMKNQNLIDVCSDRACEASKIQVSPQFLCSLLLFFPTLSSLCILSFSFIYGNYLGGGSEHETPLGCIMSTLYS